MSGQGIRRHARPFPVLTLVGSLYRLRFAILLAALPLTNGCVESKLSRNLGASAAMQRQEFSDLLEEASVQEQTAIDWAGAYRRLMDQNLSLRQSYSQLEQSRRLKRNQWLTLAPNLAIFANLGDSLSSLTDLSGDDLNVRLVGNLNIPNPFEFHAALYAAALQRQNAEWSYELDKRRAFIELHQVFADQQILTSMESQLRQRSLESGLTETRDPARAFEGIRSERRNMQRMRSLQRVRINHLLNTPGANWRLVGAPPRISYRDRIAKLRIGEDFGKLALNLQAIQIEGAILRRQRVKFQQWPAVNFGLSAPPLYSNQEDPDFSADNLYFFSGASRTVNLADPIGRLSLRDAEERLRYTREQLRLRIESESHQILQAREAYRELIAEEHRLTGRLGRIESATEGEAVILLADLEERAQLIAALHETRRRIHQLDLQLLLWDETFWK